MNHELIIDSLTTTIETYEDACKHYVQEIEKRDRAITELQTLVACLDAQIAEYLKCEPSLN